MSKVLGHGSSGTVVYEGMLHGRKVAVKRMLADFYQLAYREISLLLVADEHNNVVSYYAKVRVVRVRRASCLSCLSCVCGLALIVWCRRKTTSSSTWRCRSA
jgi:hypothetical protein